MNSVGRLRNTYAEIHLSRLRANVRQLRKLCDPQAFFCPMIKADGYGHGDIEVARVLEENDVGWAGVSLIEEGVRLRRSGSKLRILSFAFFDKHGAEEILNHSLTPVISSWDQFEKLELQLSEGQRYPIHVKFDSGMSRLGFGVSEANKVKDYLAAKKQFKLEGLCTHLLNSEDTGEVEGRTLEQQRTFAIVERVFMSQELMIHSLNSAALLKGSKCHPDSPHQDKKFLGVRPGVALYGVWPEITKQSGVSLEPVMELKSVIGQMRVIKPGDTVSYGGRWRANRTSTIGVVPIGYADGYSRQFSNKGKMLYRGQVVPVIGTVCMDYTMIDLTDSLAEGPPRVGEEVVVFGNQGGERLPVDELARSIGTISYEILTCLGKRIPRVVHHA